MILAIFGSTGGTGLELTQQALDAGHSVRALVRDPSRMKVTHERLRVVMGDVLDRQSVVKTLLGADASLSCLGQRNLFKNNQISTLGTHMIMEVMKANGQQRLVVESAFGASDSYQSASAVFRLITRTVLRNPYADKETMEPLIRESGLKWTIVRPTALTSGPKTNTYRVGELKLGAASRISRADVAAFMLQNLGSDEWVQKCPAIAY